MSREDLVSAVNVLRAELGYATQIDLYGLSRSSGTDRWLDLAPADEQGCGWDPLTGELHGPGGGDPLTDPRAARACVQLRRSDGGDGLFSATDAEAFVGGPELLALFTGMDDGTRSRAGEALNAGGVLTADLPGSLAVESVQLSVVETRFGGLTGEPEPVTVGEAVLPVHAVLPERVPGMVLGPQAAAELGITPAYLGTVFLSGEELDSATRQRLTDVVRDPSYGAFVEFPTHGWSSPRTNVLVAAVPGLIVVILIALILSLSVPQSRRQFALLDALGADPSLPPRISAALAGLLTAVGTIVGVLAAHVWAWFSVSRTVTDINGVVLETGLVHFLGVHWWSVGILVVVTPLVAAAVGSLFHRRRGTPEYRET